MRELVRDKVASVFVEYDACLEKRLQDGREIHPCDAEVYHSLLTGENSVEITSAEQLWELAKSALATSERLEKLAYELVTRERAEEIRRLRVDEEYTWRMIAEACYKAWQLTPDHWSPPSNQIAGMALCQAAAEFFLGEHYMREPWN